MGVEVVRAQRGARNPILGLPRRSWRAHFCARGAPEGRNPFVVREQWPLKGEALQLSPRSAAYHSPFGGRFYFRSGELLMRGKGMTPPGN
jgi:hypothetical protein